jgi:hypothetical protein
MTTNEHAEALHAILREAGATNSAAAKAVRAILALATPIAAQPAAAEPVLYQARTRPGWRNATGWTDWENCTPEAAADYERTPVLHDWHYEVRRLYLAAPAQAAAPNFGDWWDDYFKRHGKEKAWPVKAAAREAFAFAQAAAAPEGWKLVPIDPTNRMTFIGQGMRYESANSIGAIYAAMLLAAPEAGAGGDVSGEGEGA